MTHKDIYTKFMIEYDKANVTSSYPSLTEYEVATVLDKAYHALIAQKVTGNNVRRVALEGDLKNISDLAPLIKDDIKTINKLEDLNVYKASLPEDYLYYITASLIRRNQKRIPSQYKYIGNTYGGQLADEYPLSSSSMVSPLTSFVENNIYTENEIKYAFGIQSEDTGDFLQKGSVIRCSTQPPVEPTHLVFWYFEKINDSSVENVAIDNINNRKVKVKLVNHQIADKFIASDSNIPWVKNPVCYIEDDNVYVVCDSWNTPTENTIDITYIKTPNKFAKLIRGAEFIKSIKDFYTDNQQSYDEVDFDGYIELALAELGTVSYFNDPRWEGSDEDWQDLDTPLKRLIPVVEDYFDSVYSFECNDTVAEELISLAVAFALENVESQRLNSKLNMRGLEA